MLKNNTNMTLTSSAVQFKDRLELGAWSRGMRVELTSCGASADALVSAGSMASAKVPR
jgi:hypothetical protein